MKSDNKYWRRCTVRFTRETWNRLENAFPGLKNKCSECGRSISISKTIDKLVSKGLDKLGY